MPDAIETAGAVAQPTDYAPLTQDRYITGLYTQRSPLQDGDTTYVQSRYGLGRYDALLDGLNVEISSRGTLIRRPGTSPYNSQDFPKIFRFYTFHLQIDGVSSIRVLADCPDAVYDATGPATKQVVFTKTAGAGKTTFQAVGNTLYFTNGTDLKKWMVSTKSYQPNKAYNPGDFINDSNGNIQVAEGGINVPIVGISCASNIFTIQLDTTSPNLPDNLNMLKGISVTFNGLTAESYLNGQTLPIVGIPSANSIQVSFVHGDFSLIPETGTISTGSGVTGGSAPAWGTTTGAITQDGGQQWICKGNAIENWGIVGPAGAPTRTQVPVPVIYPAWQASSYYSTCYLIYNSANIIQKVTAFGTTGATEPVWNNSTGATTSDGSVTWTAQGPAGRNNGTPYGTGAYILAFDQFNVGQYFYQAIVGGVSGGAAPAFPSTLGSTITDGSVVWENVGIAQQWSDITSSSVSGAWKIIPLANGKTVILGAGQNVAYGTAIALPTGYSASRMAGSATMGTGFSGDSRVTAGVFSSTISGGIAQSTFQDEHGAPSFNGTTNWTAIAWSDDSAVTITSNAGFTYVQFVTLNGDTLCACIGNVHDGGSVIVPAGFFATQFISIAGMVGTDNINHIMQGVQSCTLDSSLGFAGKYNDNDGNSWSGTGGVFGIFWQAGGGVFPQTVSGGSAIVVPTAPGISIAIIQATAANGGSFGLPPGFGAANVSSTCAMSSFTPSGSNHGHGYSVSATGLSVSAFYRDGSGNQWSGGANIFAIAALLSTSKVVQAQVIVDGNGYLQDVVKSGISGTTEPVWNENEGAQTTDANVIWQNGGGYSISGTEPSTWAYSFKNSVSKAVSNTSTLTAPLTITKGNQVILSGVGSTDPQVDTIVIWRRPQGGSTLLWLDEIPAPPNGGTWTYTDNHPDSDLNPLITAPIGLANSPPPAGLNYLSYHMNRIWGGVGNIVQWCTGPSVSYGNGFEAWNPQNSANLTSAIYKFTPVTLSETGGLLCHTTSDIYCMFGDGTANAPFLPRKYAAKIGLLSYDALDVIGATIHSFSTSRKEISLDPSAGYIETGYPIGDQFKKVTTGGMNATLFNPESTMVTWHEQNSGDTALYVSDGSQGWFRYSPATPPDSGFCWSPYAKIEGGISAVQSVEVIPGNYQLLIGPQTSGPILMRDESTNADNGVPYAETYALIGCIQLVPAGMIAEIAAIMLDSKRVGQRPIVSVLIDEIEISDEAPLDQLERTSADPPLLPESESLYNDRFVLMQNGICPLGRIMMMQVDWESENAPSELLQHTIFGAKHAERTISP